MSCTSQSRPQRVPGANLLLLLLLLLLPKGLKRRLRAFRRPVNPLLGGGGRQAPKGSRLVPVPFPVPMVTALQAATVAVGGVHAVRHVCQAGAEGAVAGGIVAVGC